MIQLEKTKKLLASKEISDQHFIDVHIALEGYFKRFLFIALRLNNVQYKTGREVIRYYNPPHLREVIRKSWDLAGFNLDKDVRNYKHYKILESYVNDFTSKYRNSRFHGSYDKMKNEELLTALIKVDTLFLKTCEDYLKKKEVCQYLTNRQSGELKMGGVKDYEEVFEKILNTTRYKISVNKKDEAINWLKSNNLWP